jgi:predicted acylesterase/phospholipase RssA
MSTAATASTPFRILALAGGGVRGIFQSAFLACLEQNTRDGDLTAHFELIAGTSTGGILAVAIAGDVKPRRVRELYQTHADEIFKTRFAAGVRPGPRYKSDRLRKELQALLGDQTLGDLKVPVVLPVVNLETYTGSLLTSTDDEDVLAVDAALATAAAPTYFDPVTPATGDRAYLDGGLWANDPSLVAILHAQHRLRLDLGRLRLLSVGTGIQPAGMSPATLKKLRTYSLATPDLLVELTMGAQASFSNRFAREMLEPNQYLPVNPRLQRRIRLDDVSLACELLPGLAQEQFDDLKDQILALLSATQNLVPAPPPPLDENLAAPLRAAGITAFYASRRDYPRYRSGAASIEEYVSQATRSLKMISINLSTGILMDGLFDRFREMILDRDNPVQVTVSVADPSSANLMGTLAPVLDTTPDELADRISRTLERLDKFRSSLPARKRRFFQPRVHPALPPASAILIDQETTQGRIQLETKPFGLPMNESYAFEVAAGSQMYATLVRSYELVLATGSPLQQ